METKRIEDALYVYNLVGRLATRAGHGLSAPEYARLTRQIAQDAWTHLHETLARRLVQGGTPQSTWDRLAQLRGQIEVLAGSVSRPSRPTVAARDGRELLQPEVERRLATLTGRSQASVINECFDAQRVEAVAAELDVSLPSDRRPKAVLIALLRDESARTLMAQAGGGIFEILDGLLVDGVRSQLRDRYPGRLSGLESLVGDALEQANVTGTRDKGKVDYFANAAIKGLVGTISSAIRDEAVNAARQLQEASADREISELAVKVELELARDFRRAARLCTPERVPLRALGVSYTPEQAFDRLDTSGRLRVDRAPSRLLEMTRKPEGVLDLQVVLIEEGQTLTVLRLSSVPHAAADRLREVLDVEASRLPSQRAKLGDRVLDASVQPFGPRAKLFAALAGMRDDIASAFELVRFSTLESGASLDQAVTNGSYTLRLSDDPVHIEGPRSAQDFIAQNR